MHPLFPFTQNTSKITLSGNVERLGVQSLKVTFHISDPRGALKNGPEGDVRHYAEHELTRAHELWKDTCFEFFFSVPLHDDYYECNLNTKGKWNMYYFDSYRTPQPPRETNQYRLIAVETVEGEISAIISSEKALPNTLEVGITAIVVTSEGESFYAVAHKGNEPDFHLRESFMLKI